LIVRGPYEFNQQTILALFTDGRRARTFRQLMLAFRESPGRD
jgi:hypothetical protein